MLRLLLRTNTTLPFPNLKYSTTPPPPTATDPFSSLTLHFLQNSCGLSPSSALSASKKIRLKSTKNPHSVLSLLKSYGFSPPDLSLLLSHSPHLLLSHPTSTLRPKLHFLLNSLHFPPSLLSSHPSLLLSSLPNRLRPNLSLLRSLLPSPLSAIRRSPSLLSANLNPADIQSLLSYNLPVPAVLKLLTHFIRHPVPVPEILDSLAKFGVAPSSPVFPYAFGVFARLSGSEWERKVENFKQLGWSEAQVLAAFAKHPYCMSASREKVEKNMVFFRDRLGWDAAYVSAKPVVLSLSLKKRIVPRCWVLRVLQGKGLVKGKIGAQHLVLGNKVFLEKFVVRYQEMVPGLVDYFEGRMGDLDLDRVDL